MIVAMVANLSGSLSLSESKRVCTRFLFHYLCPYPHYRISLLFAKHVGGTKACVLVWFSGVCIACSLIALKLSPYSSQCASLPKFVTFGLPYIAFGLQALARRA